MIDITPPENGKVSTPTGQKPTNTTVGAKIIAEETKAKGFFAAHKYEAIGLVIAIIIVAVVVLKHA